MIGLITAPALAGVWTAQPSSGDSGKGCYLVIFNSPAWGNNKQLIGTGVVSGNTFTGFLKFTANPQTNGTTYIASCGADGNCAWGFAYGYGFNYTYGYSSNEPKAYNDYNFSVVSVRGLPIVSATPIGCY